MDYVEYVAKNRNKWKDYEWLNQFNDDYIGINQTPLKFLGMKMKYGMEEVAPDIAGDKQMRSLLKTDILKGKVKADIFNRKWSVDEYNDIINYYAWDAFENLSLRSQEGKNDLIPRQEYETLTMIAIALRNAEFYKFIVHKAGWEKVVRRQWQDRLELGTNMTQIAIGAWCPLVLPQCGYVCVDALGLVGHDDPLLIANKMTTLKFGMKCAYVQTGGDGLITGAMRHYAWDKEPEVVDYIMDRVKPVTDKQREQVTHFFSAAQLYSFLHYYDARGGVGDSGPYIVEDGKPMIIRTTLINEPVFSWSEISERRGLPWGYVTCCVFDPKKIGLKELRITDISTTFSSPKNFMDALEKVVIFRRWEPDGEEPLPLSKLEVVDMADLPELTAHCNDAITEWYAEAIKMSRRERITHAVKSYTWVAGVMAGNLRQLGLWDYVEENCDFWEWPPMVSESYYRATGKIVSEVVPFQIWSGQGWIDFTDKTASESKYAKYLQRAREEYGWVSDLTGTKPIPEDLKTVMDENNLLQVPMEFNIDPNWLKK